MLVKEPQRIAKMRDRDRRIFEVAFIHELAQNSDMYNKETVIMTAAGPPALPAKWFFKGGPARLVAGQVALRSNADKLTCCVTATQLQNSDMFWRQSMTSETAEAKDDARFYVKVICVFGVTLGATVLVWWIMGMKPIQMFPTNDANGGYTAAGSYGDSFGYVNSLLSSLALAGAIAAIVLQSMELRDQRKELKHSQETWKDQADALRIQSETMKAQTRVMHEQMLVQQTQNDLTVIEARIAALGVTNNRLLIQAIDNVEERISARRSREEFKTRLRGGTAIGIATTMLNEQSLDKISLLLQAAGGFLDQVSFDMQFSGHANQIDLVLEELRTTRDFETAEPLLTRIIDLSKTIEEQLPGQDPREAVKELRAKDKN